MTHEEANKKFGEYIKDAAFPNTIETDGTVYHTKGLTKREYFAAMAMQGIVANVCTDINHQENAKEAVIHADALIKALNESQPTE